MPSKVPQKIVMVNPATGERGVYFLDKKRFNENEARELAYVISKTGVDVEVVF